MDPLAGNQRELGVEAGFGQYAPRPHPGSVDNQSGRHLHRSVLNQVHHAASGHPSVRHPQVLDTGMVDDQRSVLSGGLCVLQREAGIVGDVLGVPHPTLERLAEPRELFPNFFRREIFVFLRAL